MQGDSGLILRNDLARADGPTAELYRLNDDPGQRDNVLDKHPAIAAELRERYERWWDGMSGDFDRPAEIVLGDPRQNPMELTCFEWHSSQQWGQQAVNRGFDGNGY